VVLLAHEFCFNIVGILKNTRLVFEFFFLNDFRSCVCVYMYCHVYECSHMKICYMCVLVLDGCVLGYLRLKNTQPTSAESVYTHESMCACILFARTFFRKIVSAFVVCILSSNMVYFNRAARQICTETTNMCMDICL
jgi:hypothetical protein